MRVRSSLALVVVILAGCASKGGPPAATCPTLSAMRPLPDRSCEGEEVERFALQLARRLEPLAGSLLVRVELDENARPESICVERRQGSGDSRSRESLGTRFAELRGSSSGPACLAGKRIDLNRVAALQASMRHMEARCAERARLTYQAMSDSAADQRRVADRDFRTCLQLEARWVVIDSSDGTQPILFGLPEVPNPPRLSATRTASRCQNERSLQAQIDCIERDGWELLHEHAPGGGPTDGPPPDAPMMRRLE